MVGVVGMVGMVGVVGVGILLGAKDVGDIPPLGVFDILVTLGALVTITLGTLLGTLLCKPYLTDKPIINEITNKTINIISIMYILHFI